MASRAPPLGIADRVRRFRGATPRGPLPLGITVHAPLGEPLVEGDAILYGPTADCDDPAVLALELPEPSGALIVVAESGDASLLTRVLGRRVRVPRSVRGAALLLRGYRAIGGGVDPASGLDLCWAQG